MNDPATELRSDSVPPVHRPTGGQRLGDRVEVATRGRGERCSDAGYVLNIFSYVVSGKISRLDATGNGNFMRLIMEKYDR